MRDVAIVGTAQVPIRRAYDRSLRQLGAEVVRGALDDAGIVRPDALYLANMLADELQSQKHVAALVADEAGLAGIEALQIRAATAAGAAALRVGYLAVAAGAVEHAVVVGVEKMSEMVPTPALARALDAEKEVPDGATLLSQNARLMAGYMTRYGVGMDAFDAFALNAHSNANDNPYAVFFEKQVTPEMVRDSRVIVPPLRLFDASPICDGAAAVVLGPAARHPHRPVRLLASAAATDRFRMADRPDPLRLLAVERAAAAALDAAGLERAQIDFFELHDAFSIMACLQLEAVGFAPAGGGWRLAAEGEIGRGGAIPIATMGGLKARGHPIGATALYQTCEIVAQLTGAAGPAQLPTSRHALLCSVGGAATTVLVHAFGVADRPLRTADRRATTRRATSSVRSPDRDRAAASHTEALP